MNKISIYIIAIGLLFASCSKYLDKETIGKLTDGEVLNDPTEGAVSGSVENAYRNLSNTVNIFDRKEPWDDAVFIRPDFILGDIASGDVMKSWEIKNEQNWMDDVANYNITAQSRAFLGMWIFDYDGIAKTNVAIFQLTDPTILSKINMNEDKRKLLLAESYFLRAFYYFDLVKYFGDVPLVLKPTSSIGDAVEAFVTTKKEVILKKIKDDLAFSVVNLPNSRYSNESQKWRVSKGAAIALLAKIALFEENWKEVITQVNALDALNAYALNANFFDSFDNSKAYTETENIFIFDHESGKNPKKGSILTEVLGWGFIAPTQALLDAFEPNDPRKAMTVNVDDKTVYKLAGAQSRSFIGNNDSPVDKVFIRYTDVLLWKAEALIRDQQITEGVKIINKIRERARGENTSILADHPISGVNEVTAMQWLQQERRVELAFEGHRTTDLRRWGLAKQMLNDMGVQFEDKHVLFPIPQVEINRTGGKISQNPGY